MGSHETTSMVNFGGMEEAENNKIWVASWQIVVVNKNEVNEYYDILRGRYFVRCWA